MLALDDSKNKEAHKLPISYLHYYYIPMMLSQHVNDPLIHSTCL